ncbi:S41 family peptidase [Deinococcus multiflagellatus]|uniref:S41 family peptidase n=1 Tax=Deinococcus multiflagellatus TaxID=1656887 RepID=A0ABW1ZH91_9DEIO|nr:S41 family peptidase [Deinococcus multiflagellatus]MBZ9711831.1 S41 family peptidase [Deinococcus multiflagellatus]
MNAKRLTVTLAALGATAAVAYAQLGGYTQANLSSTPEGRTFLQVLNDLNRLYLYPVDQEKVLRGAINGAIGSLNDEFTYYSEPADNAIDAANLQGEFFGIGVQLVAANADGTGGKIDNVYRGGAASLAGVQIGDQFLKIGDTDVTTAKLNEIVRLVRGEKGTTVTVTFARDGKPYTVKMERQPVTIVSVESTVLPGNIGYIALNTFYNEKVTEQFRAAVADMKKKNVKGLILDLRDNGGGLLNAGVDVADQFMQSGPIVSLRDRSKATEVFGTARRQASDYTGKLVVLVNKNSASASEVVSGALQDTGRATIVGEQTFGKGVAQIPVTLPDGGKAAIVNSEWLTPKGRQIHKKGITPDVVVKDTRYTTPVNFTGSGVKPGEKITLTIEGKPVTVTADKDGKFTYTGEIKRPTRSAQQGEATVDLQNDAILKKAVDLLK